MLGSAWILLRRVAVAGDTAGERTTGEDLFAQLGGNLGVLLQEGAVLFLALAEVGLAVFEPGAAAVENFLIQAQIKDVAFIADATGMHHVEFSHAEGRRNLVLNDLRPHTLSDDVFAVFELANAADIDAAGRIKLQGATTGRRFGAAVADADLFADLIDEDHGRFAFGDRARELAHRLAHEAGLQADVCITDYAFQFGPRHEGGDGIDDNHINRVAFDQHFGDLHGFFAIVGLADEQGFELDSELFAPAWIEGVLGVDNGGDSAGFLGLSGDMQGEGRFAARFGAEDLDDAAAGDALTTEGDVEREAAGGNARNGERAIAAQRHDRPLAELFFDLLEGGFQRAVLLDQRRGGGLAVVASLFFCLGHTMVLSAFLSSDH